MSELSPHIPTGGRVLEFDFPGIEIGVAEYEEGPTGCTVFSFGRGLPFAADVRGGSPGTLNADVGFAQAICFSGGSLLGIEAAMGVASAIFADRGHEHVEWTDVPVVAGAIIFDFGARKTGAYPDKDLGAAAYRARVPGVFPLGSRGAGRSAGVGKLLAGGTVPEPAGQGGAFRQVGDVKMAVFCVVNALGAIVDRSGQVVRGNLDPATGQRRGVLDGFDGVPSPGNTTLTMLVTNQRLSGRDLNQMARQVHASMSRCIQPFHTASDGDTLFAVSTNQVQGGPLADAAHLGILASEVAWDAVLTCWDE